MRNNHVRCVRFSRIPIKTWFNRWIVNYFSLTVVTPNAFHWIKQSEHLFFICYIHTKKSRFQLNCTPHDIRCKLNKSNDEIGACTKFYSSTLSHRLWPIFDVYKVIFVYVCAFALCVQIKNPLNDNLLSKYTTGQNGPNRQYIAMGTWLCSLR